MLNNTSQFTIELKKITEESYLSIYKNDDLERLCGYDNLFSVGDTDVFIIHEVEELQSDIENIPKNKLYEYSIKTVNALMKRHKKIQKTFKRKNKKSTAKKTYFVGLATLMVSYQSKDFSIDHQFGSTYFQEQCVLDFDAEDNLLQLFGTKSLVTILKMIVSPCDILAYLEYHRNALMKQVSYPYETILANSFLHSQQFLEQALNVEKDLIDIGVLDRHDNRLLQPTNNNNALIRDNLLAQMTEYSDLWLNLVKRVRLRQEEKKEPLSQAIMHQMIGESLYTRMKIVEDVFGYANQSQEIRDEGYIIYQHSYSRFGCQYMIVLYGTNPQSWLSKETVHQEYFNMLINLNSQLQTPVMDDLFLLGFDLSNMQESGDVDVQMDVFHLKASKMTELEQYLHDQILKLKQTAQPRLRARAI